MADDIFLQALREEFYGLALECGAAPAAAAAAAEARTRNLQRDFGGRTHYLPARPRDQRQCDILADLQRGLPRVAVAAKHDVSLSTVKRAERRARAENPGLGREEWVIK